ncbi:tyrosine-type recombinase/integrase [Sulfitobacter geojensis]|uniref:tyrosine-type recombinase/integrase n=1 Tax=Sulfitobacter geojensis TaxID=1342299 RepID=UPI0007D92938|nr:site-specific integrase [Sulfitobacter geojensis]OAN98074.1 hypothetical protein A8B74_01695 [Sulfitobacter geojensis]
MAKIIKLKDAPNGEPRYGVRFKEDGKQRQRSFKSRAEAQLFRSQKEVEQPKQRRTLARKEGTTFQAVAEAYLTSLEHPPLGYDPKEPVTIKTYRSILREHVNPHVGAKDIRLVKASDYQSIHSVCNQVGMSPRTRNEALRLMQAVLKYAHKNGEVDHLILNPIDQRLSRAEKQKKKIDDEQKFFSPDEIYTLLAAADSLAQDDNGRIRTAWARYRPMVYFLVYTGARISEARAWTRADYRPKDGWIHINYSAPEGKGTNLAKASDSIRRIPLNPELCEPIETYMKSHKRHLVFGTREDTPMSLPPLYTRLLSPLMDRADALSTKGTDPRLVKVRRDRTFHAFRHHYASWLIKEGANLKQLSSYMGHAKVTFTLEVYGHLFDEDGAELASRMSMKKAM